MRFLITILVSILLLGCFTQKKAVKQLNNIQNKYPTEVVKFLNKNYPIRIIKKDSIIRKDSIIEKKVPYKIDTTCPDGTKIIIDSFYTDTTIWKIKEIIKWYEDSLKLASLKDYKDSIINTYIRNQNNDKKIINKKIKSVTVWRTIALCIIGLFTLFLFIVIKLK